MSNRDKNDLSNRNLNHQNHNTVNQGINKKLIINLIISAFALGALIATGITFLLLKANEFAKTKTPPSPISTFSPTTETPQVVTPSPTPINSPDASPSPISTFSPTTETPQLVTPSPTPINSPDAGQSTNTEQKTPVNNSDILTTAKEFNDRVSFNSQEKNYSFTLEKPSNVSIYLDKVTDEVGVELYVDTNGNGFVDNNEQLASDSAYTSRAGAIHQVLGANKYIVIVRFKNNNSDYTLQLVNNTYETVNVGILKGNQTFNGSINRNNRQKLYNFRLSNPSNVNIFLDKVTSQLDVRLFLDKNADGVIDENNEQLTSDSAYSSRPGKISQTLGANNYFVVISEREINTDYTLTLSSQ